MARIVERKTAEIRREEILEAALIEFAEHGLAGTSTDAIARRVGISQPYLFRLFGTKKELFVASVQRCLDETLEMFREASAGLTGAEALHAIGEAYTRMIVENPHRLRGQMQAYAACDDEEICTVVRRGFGALVDHAERVSGLPPEQITNFFAFGMLLNVIASMKLLDADEPWAKRLIEGCGKQ